MLLYILNMQNTFGNWGHADDHRMNLPTATSFVCSMSSVKTPTINWNSLDISNLPWGIWKEKVMSLAGMCLVSASSKLSSLSQPCFPLGGNSFRWFCVWSMHLVANTLSVVVGEGAANQKLEKDCRSVTMYSVFVNIMYPLQYVIYSTVAL